MPRRRRRAAGEPIRVAVCDDHSVYRRGLALVLGPEADLEVVGEAADGEQLLDLAHRVDLDVVLLDVRMPGLGGIETARRLALEVPALRVVMLTVSDDADDLFEAVKAGVAGYLLKDVSIAEIADAVRAVDQGAALLAPSMTAALFAEFAALARRSETGSNPPAGPRLTVREVEVLGHISHGLSNRDIADELFISENTVKNHVRNLLEKLGLHSRTEAALYAVREKIVDPGG